MAASDNLSEGQFGPLYHGTSRDFNPGDIITPAGDEGSHHGSNPVYGEAAGDFAYATDDIEEAKHFAESAATVAGGTPSVYEVEPMGKTTVRPLYGKGEDVPEEAKKVNEHLSRDGFKVKRKI